MPPFSPPKNGLGHLDILLNTLKFDPKEVDFVVNLSPELVGPGVRVGLDVLGDPQDGLCPGSLDLILLGELLIEAVAHL